MSAKTTTMNNTSVLSKLNEAREIVHSSELKKTGYNTYSKYAYFQLSDFLPQTLKAFYKLKLCGLVSFGLEEATLKITCLETGEVEPVTSPMSTAKLTASHEVQNLGAVETYLRRYLWSAAMEIIELDRIDASPGAEDEVVHHAVAPVRQKPPPQTKATKAPTTTQRAEDEEIWDVLITSVTPSTGVGKNGKPFHRWQLKFEDGRQISTFDKKLGESLQEGEQVRLITKQDGKFHKLVGIEEAHEELVREPGKAEMWQTDILNVEKSKNGKYWQVFLNDIEHPWVGTVDKDLATKAAQWIEGGEVNILVKPGKGDIWELIDVPKYEASLEEEFGEKEAE